uniref:Uncharacterized protein n=1 Tax=Arundo donax TaxID=35708 RepID=A0A0A8YJX5_ARUDO
MVNVFEFEGPLQEMKEEVVEEEQPLNMQATSSKGHHAVPQNTSELQGVIWPTHIMERPESEFKQKLMEVLNKPFNLAEYDDLLATATNRTPVIKERRTRRRVVNYPWKYEMSKSYFDCYPDLADLVERNSYPNRLALLRGFFFWLKNIGHEDQFRPWRDDYKKYRVFHDYYP